VVGLFSKSQKLIFDLAKSSKLAALCNFAFVEMLDHMSSEGQQLNVV
jgi:hypothetical protein